MVRFMNDPRRDEDIVPLGAVGVRPDGTFGILAPSGRSFTLVATTGSPWVRAGVQRDVEWGTLTATLGQEGSRDGIALHTQPGGVVHGKIVSRFGESPHPAIKDLRVFSEAPDETSVTVPGSASVADDGSFELHNVVGCQKLVVGGPGGILVITQASIGGRSSSTSSVCVNGGERLSDVRLTVDRPAGEVVGTVHSALRGAIANSVVVLFACDVTKWHDPSGHYIRVSRSDDRGRFWVRQLIPGKYYVVAISRLRLVDAYDDQTLTRLSSLATRIDVKAADNTDVRLEIMEAGAQAAAPAASRR
jgi:hypothetical protein